MSNSADNINYLILSYAVYLKFFFLFFFLFFEFHWSNYWFCYHLGQLSYDNNILLSILSILKEQDFESSLKIIIQLKIL